MIGLEPQPPASNETPQLKPGLNRAKHQRPKVRRPELLARTGQRRDNRVQAQQERARQEPTSSSPRPSGSAVECDVAAIVDRRSSRMRMLFHLGATPWALASSRRHGRP